MNTDRRGLKANDLSAFISVNRRPEIVFHQPPMPVAIAIVVITCAGWAQFKSTAPLVVAPTTVTDSKGRYVTGRMPGDWFLSDKIWPQPKQMDWLRYPISLVVAGPPSPNSGPWTVNLAGT